MSQQDDPKKLIEVSSSVTLTNRYVYWLCLISPITLQVAYSFYLYYFWLNQHNNYQLDLVWKTVLFGLKLLSFIPFVWALLTFLGLLRGHPPDVKVTFFQEHSEKQPVSQSPNLKKIYDLLIEGFSQQELRDDLCFFKAEFRPLRDQLDEGASKVEIVRRLLEYAERKKLVEKLLDWAKEQNPAQYEEHQPYYVVATGATISSVDSNQSQGAKSTSDTEWCWNKKVLLIVSYVSKGENQKALKRSLEKSKEILDEMKVRYEIEIVTDKEVSEENRITINDNKLIHYCLVPQDYKTKTETKYKARALQYNLGERIDRFCKRGDTNWQDKDVWVLHLDEESIITPQAIVGIKDFIGKYSLTKPKTAIGQGEIFYNSHNYGKCILITAMDSLRTGDDLGRLRFQYNKLHKPIAGMHEESHLNACQN